MIFDLQKFGDGGGSTSTSYEPTDEERQMWKMVIANAEKSQPAVDYLRDAGMWALGDTVSQMYNAFNSSTRGNGNSFPSFAQWQAQKAAQTQKNTGNFMPLLGVDYTTKGKNGVIQPISSEMEEWLEQNGYSRLGKNDYTKIGLSPNQQWAYEKMLDNGKLNLWQR